MYTNTGGAWYVPLATVFDWSPIQTSWGGYGWDPIPSWLNSSMYTIGTYSALTALGAFPTTYSRPLRIPLAQVKPAKMVYDPQVDELRYGNRLSGIKQFKDLLLKGSLSVFDDKGERPTRHVSYRGEVGPQLGNNELWRDSGDVYGYWGRWDRMFYEVSDTSGQTSRNVIDMIGAGDTDDGVPRMNLIRRSGLSPLYPNLNRFSELIRRITDELGWYWVIHFPTWCPSTLELKNFQYQPHTNDKVGGLISYTVINTTRDWGHAFPTPYCRSQTWDVELRFDFTPKPVPATHDFVLGSYERIQSVGDFTYSRKAICTEAYSYWEPSWALTHPFTTQSFSKTLSDFCLADIPSKADESIRSTTELFPNFRKSRIRAEFQFNVDRLEGDIIRSAICSTSDALSDVGVDTNVIEALYELQGISELLPDISSLVKAVKALAKGRYLESLYDYVDFATSLNLSLTFGLNPTVEFFLTVIPRIYELLNTVQRSVNQRRVVRYGTFKYTFPEGEFGRTSSTLLTRTKVTHYQQPSNVLSILGSLGLKPFPSNFWDLVPMSFVVDWVVGIGTRLNQLETYITYMDLDVVSLVHTFRVDTPLTDTELNTFGFRRNELFMSDPPGMRWFVRDISRHFPPYYDGRYDFQLPQKSPPWELSGSLAFQILFGGGKFDSAYD